MMKIFIALSMCMAAFAGTPEVSEPVVADAALNTTLRTAPVRSSMSRTEGKVRDAAVRVSRMDGGHGSGSVIEYKGSQFVLTAQHVANGPLGETYLIQKQSEQRVGILVYLDPLNDIVLLWLGEHEEFENLDPMPWRPLEEMATVGTRINYSGYPGQHALLTFRGYIAGYATHPDAGAQLILNVFGWFGSSGSIIYTQDGKIVGILYGVDVDYYREQINEDIIWVTPIQNFNIDLALQPLCEHIPELVVACK